MNQLKTSEDALGVQTQYQYNSMGDLTEVIECLNTSVTKKTTMNYTQDGRLVSVVDPMEQTASYTYDNVGNVKTVTDANGGTATNTYNKLNRLIETVDAIGAKETYTYNSKGLMKEITNSRNQKTQYTYDVLGRIKTLKDEEGTIEYTYDASGNITNVKDKNGTTERTFDALNRVTSITDHNGRTIEYSYDELGNRISLTYPGGEIVRYTYTKTGNLATVTDPDHRKTYYDYDANGRLIQTLRPDGSVEKRSYDAKGQLTKISDQIGSKILLQDSFTYDEAGNITKISKTQDEYADISKLTDALMTYDAQNRMLTYNGETIEYDADGNMTYGPLAGVMTKFTYDCRNRLVQAGDYHYEYNSENVRISTENKEIKWSYLVDPQATYSQILITETYEKNLLGQFSKLTGSTLYTYGLGLISESSEKSGYLVYHFDQLGSTKCITDKDGKTVYTMSYGSYGELFGIQDAKGNLVNFKDNPIAFLYNGQYGIVTDQNTLLYMRARYYNPEIKRFLNQDVLTGSIGNSQSLNRYSYVQGNPIRFTDPFGLCPDGSGVQNEDPFGLKGIADYLGDLFCSYYGMVFAPGVVDLPHPAVVTAMHAQDIMYTHNQIQKHQSSMKGKYSKLHGWMAVLGFVPVLGIAPDVIDLYVYAYELDFVGMGLSIACIATSLFIPLVVDQMMGAVKGARAAKTAKGAKLLFKGTKVANAGTDATKVRGTGKLSNFLKGGLNSIIKNGNVAIDDIKANPSAFSGKSADEIAQVLKESGYDVTVQSSKRSSSGAKIIKINNPGGGKNITQVQVSPGGGRHGANPYVKISTSDQGIIKIVDGIEEIYKTDGKETSTIIFTGGK